MYISLIVVGTLTLFELLGGDTLRGRVLNLFVLVFDRALAFVFVPLVALAVPVHLIDGKSLPFWLGALIFVLVGDLFAYLFHRAQHAIPFMWAMHSLHHSDEHLNATTTERHFWADRILKSVSSFPLAALVIHPTPPMVFFGSILSLWNYVAHANIKLNFGRWSWLLNCPAYHRRHHSLLPEHFNSNYAAIFPIWDVIAGSYFVANDYPPTGLDDRKAGGFGDALIWPLRDAARRRHRVTG